jgi:hypothetical protein
VLSRWAIQRGAQRLEAHPAVVRAQLHGEQITELAVEVGEVGARVRECGDGQIRHGGEALGDQAQRHALARTDVAADQREAAFAHERVLDTPGEVLHRRREAQRLGGQFGREGIPLQTIKGEQLLVHRSGSSARGASLDRGT